MSLRSLLAVTLATIATSAMAQVTATDPWVRATVPQQHTTGAFVRLTSAADARLVEARSPVAGTVEIHEMSMENNVMKMRRMSALDLPAGRPVDLKPGSYHLMLLDLKQQVKAGEMVPLTLVIERKEGGRETVELQAQVRPLGAQAAGH